MPQIVETFAVETQGIGRVDFTKTVERSTSNVPTSPLRQTSVWTSASYVLPVGPYPLYYIAVWPLPQENGTWAYPASTIMETYNNVAVSITKNALVGAALVRFASLADYYILNIAEYFPRLFGYGKVVINLTTGISTRPGSVYGLLFGFWTGGITERVTINVHGLVWDLTPPWMT